MSSYWNSGIRYRQPTTSELKKRSAESIRREKGKGSALEPVCVTGRTIAKNWWGQAWCSNLEQYADYASRLDRGKRYIRTGAVLDLKIEKGKIRAKVQGTRKTPYKIEIRISPLSEEKCQEIIKKCSRKIENLESLLSGTFPEELKELFQGNNGLFPEPKEISFNCSCPDWALLCKHVAAALYGVGVRLDNNPALFFQLRGINMDHFIDVTLANKVETMLENAGNFSSRIIEGNVDSLFGVL